MSQLLFPDIPVLLVEDSLFVRSMVRRMLRQVGLRNVTEVGDGEGALDALQTFSPELLLLDWHLPSLNGGQLLEIIRDPQISARTDLPVILFSGAPTKALIERAGKLGVTCFLKKPFSPSDLWKRMHALGFGDTNRQRHAV
ncbi:response regulator [Alsobacter metallidurans]|uniref:Response regulator n=1 Tax=Alsobacter metallidurans TaxID=340221 RepID=A0A917MIC4_9HYPH|nr:response regulator [Alsobacter metallidurans]GGH22474.1 response regulator [Alsobacter metallidurans]